QSLNGFLAGIRQIDHHRFRPWYTAIPAHASASVARSALGILVLLVFGFIPLCAFVAIVAPLDNRFERGDARRDKNTQAHRSRKESLLGCSAIGRRRIVRSRSITCGIDFIRRGLVAPLLYRRAR